MAGRTTSGGKSGLRSRSRSSSGRTAADRVTADTVLKRAYAKARIVEGQPWKILRHTFGSRGAEAGLAVQGIQYLMGHRSPVTTARYMHLSPEYLELAAKKLATYTDPCTKPQTARDAPVKVSS